MKILFFTAILGTCLFAQSINFIVVDEFDVTGKPGKDKFVELVNTLNQQNGIEFVLFNGLRVDLNDADDLVKRTIKNIKHPVYILPAQSNFWQHRSAREDFMNDYNDLFFRRNYDTLKALGLNTTVSWSDKPFFEREVLTFIKDQKLDWLASLILILNSDPTTVKNFDAISNLFAGSKIKFIAAPIGTRREFTKENVPILSTSVNSRANEVFKIIEYKNDSLFVSTSDISGKTSTQKFYSIIDGIFPTEKHNYKFDPDKILRWSYDLGYSTTSKVITHENRIYAADISGQVVCLDTLGKKRWDYFSFGYIYSKPTARDEYLAIATIQGDLETVNARTGKPLQSIGFDSPITSDLVSFDYSGNYNLMIPKQSRSKAAVIVGTQSGRVYCYDMETMQELWKFTNTQGAITGEPLIVKGQILFYSLDGTLYCINANTGLLTWKSKITGRNESDIYASSLTTNQSDVFISLSNGKLFSYDLLLGKKNWEMDKYNLNTTLHASNDGRLVYAKSTNDRFHILSAKLGTWVREIITKFGGDKSHTDIVELGKNIYYGNEEGYLIEIDENYKYNRIFRSDFSPIFSITPLSKNRLVVANHSGTISLIRIKN